LNGPKTPKPALLTSASICTPRELTRATALGGGARAAQVRRQHFGAHLVALAQLGR